VADTGDADGASGGEGASGVEGASGGDGVGSAGYRWYLAAQVLSLFGTMMSYTALFWLALHIRYGGAAALAAIDAAQCLPMLLFSRRAGVIVARHRAARVAMVTQGLEAAGALAIGVPLLAGRMTIWYLVPLSFVIGCVACVDLPARQTFMLDLVGPGDLRRGSSLFATVTGLARIAGQLLLLAPPGSRPVRVPGLGPRLRRGRMPGRGHARGVGLRRHHGRSRRGHPALRRQRDRLYPSGHSGRPARARAQRLQRRIHRVRPGRRVRSGRDRRDRGDPLGAHRTRAGHHRLRRNAHRARRPRIPPERGSPLSADLRPESQREATGAMAIDGQPVGRGVSTDILGEPQDYPEPHGYPT